MGRNLVTKPPSPQFNEPVLNCSSKNPAKSLYEKFASKMISTCLQTHQVNERKLDASASPDEPQNSENGNHAEGRAAKVILPQKASLAGIRTRLATPLINAQQSVHPLNRNRKSQLKVNYTSTSV